MDGSLHGCEGCNFCDEGGACGRDHGGDMVGSIEGQELLS